MTKMETLKAMAQDVTVMANADYKAYVEKEIENLNKKAESKASSPKARENEVLKEKILVLLTNADEPMRAKHIAAKLNAEGGTSYSTNKISAMLKPLKDDGKVLRTQVKKDVFFSIA